ncbi:helix-turn-helix domain-containing protein [Candidatus Bipolaricaulota bacterium]|nr:helix-turn-helix domain-containing protein [Candidatus Bipolaricaulota bacterium]
MEEAKTVKNNQRYNLSAKEAAKKLGKSVTTVHRYLDKGKLSGRYVNTDHGKEVRLSKSEVESLAEKLEAGRSFQTEKNYLSGEEEGAIEVRELLERYERTLHRLGRLTEKLEAQKERRKNKLTHLEEEKDQLTSQLADKQALIESLQSELSRPLTLGERLSGKRSSNQ